MTYGLPTRGQADWDDELNSSVEALRGVAQTADARASAAVSTANAAANLAADAKARAEMIPEQVEGPPGKGIASIARTAGTGAPSTVDTYTITYTDSSTSTFQVTNGSQGEPGEPGDGSVNSVNGDPGPDVVLDAASVGARPDSWAPSWSDVSGKPAAFTPAAHSHAQADVTGLAASLAAKADLVGGVIPTNQIPAVATTERVSAANQAAMLALTTVQPGDIAVRLDLGTSFMLGALPASTLANWIALDSASDVNSVNGQTGTVVLSASDVGARPAGNVPWGEVSSKPTFATVATSGAYGDLSGRPTLGTAAAANAADFAPARTAPVTQTGAAYTFVLADADRPVDFNRATAQTVTVPTNASVAFGVGTVIEGARLGAGEVTFVGASGVTIRSADGLKLTDQYAVYGLRKIATDEWVLYGRTGA